MKFLALQLALKKALPKPPVAVTHVVQRSPEPKNALPVSPPASKRELVAGGEIIWKPVDRQAAKLLMKSSWIHQPPHVSTKTKLPSDTTKSKPRNPKRKMKNAISESGGTILTPSNDPASGSVNIAGQVFFSQDHIVQQVIEAIQKQPGRLTELARAALDARNVLRENTRELGSGMEDFKAKSSVALEDLRQTRMAFVTEAAKLTGPLKDIRQFFLGSDYEQQLTRLRDFVCLCERLQKLKDSGFLDAVADTMLRLSETETR